MLFHFHKQAMTTPKVRATIQASDAPVSHLAERFRTTEQTVYKWRRRDGGGDRSHTPKRLQTTLTPAQEAATGEHEFDMLCAALEIEHRLIPPKSPQTNGMVKRFNRRIEEVLQSHHFRSGEEQETTLHRYVWLYNQQLPQSALNSKTLL